MSPEQGDFLRHFTLVSLRNEHPVTLRVIRAIPEDKKDYRPTDVARSASELAWHIVSSEQRFLSAVVNGAFDFSATRPDAVQSIAHICRWYGDTFQRALEGIRALPAAELVKLASTFSQRVTVNGIDAKSLLSIMALGLTKGAEVEIASDDPDGLAKVSQDAGFADAEKEHDAADGPLADYETKGVDDPRLSGGVAGIAGSLVVLLLAGGLVLLVRRRRDARPRGPRPAEPAGKR